MVVVCFSEMVCSKHDGLNINCKVMSTAVKKGALVISLDFELYWGVRDKRTLEKYGHALGNVHQIIPQLLKQFNEHKIKATFSTVGLLYFDSYESIVPFIPEKIPSYEDENLNPY